MRNTSLGNSLVGRCGPGAACLFWLTAAPLAALIANASTGIARAEVIEWKFRAGEVLRYSLEQKMVKNVKGTGRETKSMLSHTFNLRWTVKNVAANGDAEIVHRIDRVRVRIESPPYMPFEFDSDAPNVDAPPPFDAIAQQTKATAGAEFSFKMTPSGEIANIVISPQTIKSLRDAEKTPEGGGEGAFSEQAIKDMLLQSSPPPFPAGEIEPGKSWSSKPAKIPTPMGNLVMDKLFTFQGPDPKNSRLLLIGMEARVALEPDKNSAVAAKIRSQEGKGSLTFDATAGRIVSTRSTEKMDMLMSAMGQDIDQSTESTTAMTLQP